MSRPLRIEYPGASYHVVNRGNQRQKVFHSPLHYELFLEKLAEFSIKFGVTVRCYCLMPNHFHLYLQTSEANLARFMQSFLTSFCYSLNRMRRKSGHIFQGRFKSHIADDEAYGMAISRYIHLNPVRMKSFDDLDADGKIRCLNSFKHSSYRFYVEEVNAPEWLDISHVLSRFKGSSLRERRRGYRRYVEEAVLKEVENPLSHVVAQCVIGDDAFVEDIRCGYAMNLNLSDGREQKSLAILRSSFKFEDVLSAVAKVFGAGADEMIKRRSGLRKERMVLMYCVEKYCRAIMPITEMAAKLSIGHGGLSRSKNRLVIIMEKDPGISRILSSVEKILQQ